jgi:multidrug efflux pump subunit AcrA (membrane-fusion protein)
MTNIYHVTAKRWEHGWELHIDGVGVTQSRGVADAEEMVRHYLELEGLREPFAVNIEFRADDDLDIEIQQARQAAQEAARAQEAAAQKARSVARRLAARKYKGVEIAAVLGVSKQRVSQLVHSGKATPNRSRKSGQKKLAA